MTPPAFSRGNSVETEEVRGTTHVVMTTPILQETVLKEIEWVLKAITESGTSRPVVFRSAHPTVFLAGADLSDIARLDATNCAPYARRGRRVVRLLEAFPGPVVAAVNGSCTGGGFDLVMACDAIVAGPLAAFSHPGINRGLVTGWSGTTRLPNWAGMTAARTLFLEGSNLEPDSARGPGFLQSVSSDPTAEATGKALGLAGLDSSRRSLWRALRGPGFVDRFRASVVHKLR